MLLWAAGTAAAFARMFAAFIAMRRVQRSARPFPDDGLASALAQALGIRYGVRVLESRPGGMPMTFGLPRPAVFMPPEAAAWSEERPSESVAPSPRRCFCTVSSRATPSRRAPRRCRERMAVPVQASIQVSFRLP